jgi:hypothetical protein
MNTISEHEVTEDSYAELPGTAQAKAGLLATAIQCHRIWAPALATDEEVVGEEPAGHSDA